MPSRPFYRIMVMGAMLASRPDPPVLPTGSGPRPPRPPGQITKPTSGAGGHLTPIVIRDGAARGRRRWRGHLVPPVPDLEELIAATFADRMNDYAT